MKKRVYLIAAVMSGALAVFSCTTSLYTGEYEIGKSAIGAGLGSLVGAGIGAFPSSKKDHDRGALIDAAVGTALDGDVGYYMDVQETKLRDKIRSTSASVTRSGNNIIFSMPNNTISDNSSAAPKPAGTNTLTGVVMVLKEYSKVAVNMIGYIDSVRNHDPDMHLSQQRAGSAASVLITQSMDTNRIYTQGLGLTNPTASNSIVEGKAQSRRVEIISGPL